MEKNASVRLREFFSEEISFAEAFNSLFENASDAIYILDMRGNFVAINRKAEELTGFRREDFIGKSFRKIISSRSLPKAIKGFWNVVRGKEVRFELEIKTAAKKTILVEVTSRPFISQGMTVGAFGIVRSVSERVLIARALEEANRKLEMLLETAMEGVTIADPNGNLSFVNKAFANMLGYREEELIGANLRKLVDEEGFKRIRRETEARKKGAISRYEIKLYRKNGEQRIVQVSASPFWNEDGRFAGTLGIIMDVTERRKAEEALRESQQKFERLFKGNPEAAVFVDINDRVLDINPRFSELFGYSSKESIGKALDELIVPKEKREEAEELTVKTMTGYIHQETVRKRRDGSLVPVLMSAAPITTGGQFIGCVVLYADVTERKKAEEALRESEEKFRSIFENANDGFVYLDKSGKILDVNRKAVEIFGGTREEILGKHFAKLGVFSLKDIPRLLGIFARILAGKEGYASLTIKNKKGQERFLESSSSIMRINGKMTGILVITRDVTERNQMQKKLEEYSQQLETLVEQRTKQLREAQEQLVRSERLAAIGQVAAMVGHDLRNPLTSIASVAYYLKKKLDQKTDETTREMLEIIEKDIEYSDNIITDLLDYSREVKLELTETNLKTVVNEALSAVKVPRNVEVLDVTEFEQLRVDKEKMKRVFVNIIKNAVDAMPKGGKLTIRDNKANNELEVSFTDTGTGMTRDVLERMWTPFFTTKAKGLGLGLPICKRIVEAHGGNVSVESTAGKGTAFKITIPIRPKQEGGEKVWVNVPESSLSTTTKA